MCKSPFMCQLELFLPFAYDLVLWSPELKNLLEFKYLPDKSWNLI